MIAPGVRPLKVTLPYRNLPHLQQIYAGFQRLEQSGFLTCEWVEDDMASASPASLSIRVADAIAVHYDISDGFNWIVGGREENFDFFSRNAPKGIYFKRSYHPLLAEHAPYDVQVFPLGLNYFVSARYIPATMGIRARAERRMRDSTVLRALFQVEASTFRAENYEALPQFSGQNRIMMFTRLWDPQGPDVRSDQESKEREAINSTRLESLAALKTFFGSRFTGGVYADEFSKQQVSGELLLPWKVSEKRSYLREVQRHAICVATAGLHGSTGWRFGEYVAASRAIVSERLSFEVGPGFIPGQNFVEFDGADSLVSNLDELLSEPGRIRRMMVANYQYYHARLKPESLIMNTLNEALTNYEGGAAGAPPMVD